MLLFWALNEYKQRGAINTKQLKSGVGFSTQPTLQYTTRSIAECYIATRAPRRALRRQYHKQ